MILRVDEFPRCDKAGKRMYNVWLTLERFMEIVRAPFGLAVVIGEGDHDEWADDKAIERLETLEGVTLLSHGLCHRRIADTTAAELHSLASRFATPRVLVPPHNIVNQNDLARLTEAGFSYVCTGPETRTLCPDISFNGIKEIPSAFYGYLDKGRAEWEPGECSFAEWDCITLHICWEARTARRWIALREFCERYRSEIRPWPQFFRASSQEGLS